jgi:hypothetical protein
MGGTPPSNSSTNPRFTKADAPRMYGTYSPPERA